MTTPFGPQLIGETEKTLNALLARYLDEPQLTEPQWVTLRVASMLDVTGNVDDLAAAVTDRAHFADAAGIVDELARRGLLDDGRLSAAGRELLDRLQGEITDDTRAIFGDLASDDMAATERVLNEIVSRARLALAR